MNVRERLKEAYENVSYNADKTWSDCPSPYHTTNLELYLTEQHIQNSKLVKIRPRTVRDSIPQSRLAQYSNFEYNESREMSYACDFSNTCRRNVTENQRKEVWETPEIDELYFWFMKNLPEDNCSRLEENSYESPLLKVNGFEDRILKIQVTEDRVKNIWRNEKFYDKRVYKSYDIFINVYMTPLKNFYLIPKALSFYSCAQKFGDFEQLECLSQSVTTEIEGIFRYLEGGPIEASQLIPETPPQSSEVLYSEVLQGLAPGRKHLSQSFRVDQNSRTAPVKVPEDQKNTPLLPQDSSFTNYTVLSSHRLNPPEHPSKRRSDDCIFINPKPDQVRYLQNNVPKVVQNFPQLPTKSETPKYSSSTTQGENLNMRYNRYPNHNNQCFLDRQTRNAYVHPFSTSCVQQTYFYTPMPPVQRWLQPNYPNSCYPTQIFTSSWITQQSYDANRVFGAPATPNSAKINSDIEVTEDESGEMYRDNPVSTSVSEELEIQALEQYSNSNENFYQDLEKEAAEQYASSSE